MKSNKFYWMIIIASFLATLAIYPTLPDMIPLHWNFRGQVDRIGGKTSIFITALLPAALYLLMLVVPKIDPKKENYLKHAKAYGTITLSIVVLMVFIHWISILAALGMIKDVGFIVKMSVGILFIILGNVMPKLKFNYFAGIRTPWTLSNEEVWKKTHRIGGICFVALGALMIVLSFFQGLVNFIIFMAGTLALMVFTFVYSYLEHRKATK